MKHGAKKKDRKVLAQNYREASAKEVAKADNLIVDWTRGGHRHIDLKKADGNFRLLWENFDNLQILTDSIFIQKMRSRNAHRKRYSANMIAGCEKQTNWYKVPDGQQFDKLVGLGEHTKCKAANNSCNKTRCQPGGTVIATFGRALGYDMEMDKDKTGLGQ